MLGLAPAAARRPAPTREPIPLLAIALVSAAALGYEILLMRLFSIIQWHHSAYMMISLALLGYGASGTFLTIARRWLQRRFLATFALNAALFGVSSVACFLAAQRVGFNPLEILWDPRQPLRLLAIYLLLSVPFFCAANAIGLGLYRFHGQAHRIYSFDLLGAGTGSLGIVLLMFALHPLHVLAGLGALGMAAAAVAYWECGERGWAGPLLLAAALGLSLVGYWAYLQPSPYKGLSQLLQVPDTRVMDERWSPLGLLSVVQSPVVPLRHAPGLSLNASTEPPPQLAVFTDGDALSAITRFDGRREPLAYLDYLSSALPYHLLQRPQVLVLGAGGGADVLQALYHEAGHITAVELNPQLIDLVRREHAGFAGGLYDLPQVTVHQAEARGFVVRSGARYDLIQLALLDSFSASSAGLHALSESYLYTVEALHTFLRHLEPGGLLAITRWLKLPPRDTLKLFATAVSALERSGVQQPGAQLVLIRSWTTTTLLMKNGPFTMQEIAAIRTFCTARSFDVAYYPGMAAAEANRYNILDRPYLFEGSTALLGSERDQFMQRYKFNIAPATDDRPYFFHFFKWSALPELLALKQSGGLALLESGYLVLVAALLQAVLASIVLILAPLAIARRGSGRDQRHIVPRWRVLFYFLGLGLAFLFIEIAFIQKFMLVLHHPLYAVAVVLASFLLFAGMGSRYSGRLRAAGDAAGRTRHALAWIVAGIAVLALLYLWLLPGLEQRLAALPDLARVAFSAALIAPLAFLMGMPFPLGIAALGARAPDLIPWAWAINGCASVVSAVLATLLAIHLGFAQVIVLALLVYGAAALSDPAVGTPSSP